MIPTSQIANALSSWKNKISDMMTPKQVDPNWMQKIIGTLEPLQQLTFSKRYPGEYQFLMKMFFNKIPTFAYPFA